MQKYVLFLFIILTNNILAQETEIPLQPHIILVTTDSISQKASIKWEPSISAHIAHYVLYLFKGKLVTAVDTLPPSARETQFKLSNATNVSERFALCAIDSSNRASLVDSRDEIIHQTIHLKAIRDTCTGDVNLSWNNYPAIETQLKGYKLYTYQSNNWVLINTFTTSTLSFISNEASTGNDEFLLEAFGTNLRVYSNHPQAPLPGKSFLQFENAKAEYTTEGCQITASIKGGSNTDSLVIYQSIDCNSNKKEFIRNNPYLLNQGSWLDKQSIVIQGKSYQIEIHNRCGKTIQQTCIKPLGLFVMQENEKFHFYWTKLAENTSYQFEKIENGIAQNLATTRDTFSLYTPDNIINTEDAIWCFRVTATNTTWQPTQSNIVCFSPEPIIKTPEVFTPDGNGKNDFFKPAFLFTQPVTYSFTVYDKLGRRVYISNNYNDTGWDGRIKNGTKALSGDVYVYTLTYSLKNGKHYIKRGNIAIYLPQ